MQNSIKDFIKPFQRHENDNGSTEVQIAMLTWEISQLQDHLKENKHDIDPKRSLLKKVARRKKFIKYLKDTEFESYKTIVKKLKLRG